MTKLNELFPSKYLKAIDVSDGPMRVTIDSLEQENVSRENPNELKPVLHFEGHKRGLVLNVTNGNAIGELYGDDCDDWPGKVIELFGAKVPFGTKIVDAIRVRAPQRELPPEALTGTDGPAF